MREKRDGHPLQPEHASRRRIPDDDDDDVEGGEKEKLDGLIDLLKGMYVLIDGWMR